MDIMLAKSAGFCFGVKNAVKTAYEKAESEEKLYTYGPIIHNKVVTDDLAKKGVNVIDSLDKPLDGKVIIRSHGVPPDVYKKLDEKGLEYFDCTCPFVKKIHHIVEERHKNGMQVIIIGNAVHPEVIGINGWCGNSAVIINSAEEARNFEPKDGTEYAVVSQTTFQTDIFDEIIEILSSKIKFKLDRTICLATAERQKEAAEIANQVDCMIILGDTKSSNTRKLYEISKKYCKNTFLFETIVDLDLKSVLKYGKIGITAGASTPPAIIKEAVETMSEIENKSFEEMLNESMVTLRSGDIVKGTVISVSPETGDVSVNLGFKSDGII
ncbi:MAG: 4-hydroxy-3-methylbut-2-enyl diphosphate reductase, partial [Firmicutes bacterium]|nr:4-hydroxy-3-methylbut-2-enyl diphosphate reductase [Bacillota bacterium]